MEPWKLALLKAVTKSAAFQRRDPLNGDVLSYLARHSEPHEHHLRTEKALLDQPFFKNRSVAKIPVFLARLQEALDEYFDHEGAHHEHRIDILRGRSVDPRSPEHNAVRYPYNHESERFTRLFWKPHLDTGVGTHIAYGLPLFTRSPDQEVFTRRIEENFDREARARRSPEEVCWPFVTLGDILCTLELMRWLSERDVHVTSQWYRAESRLPDIVKSTSDRDNLIVIGSTRVNGILNEYQRRSRLPFRLDLRHVNRVNEKGEPVAAPYIEEREPEATVPVVVTRRPGVRFGSVTMIASNHGRAVHRAGEILMKEELLCELFQDSRLTGWAEDMPERFQIVLSITVHKDEMFAGRHVIEDAWREASAAPRS